MRPDNSKEPSMIMAEQKMEPPQIPIPKNKKGALPVSRTSRAKKLLSNRASLREAVLLLEILNPPYAVRE